MSASMASSIWMRSSSSTSSSHPSSWTTDPGVNPIRSPALADCVGVFAQPGVALTWCASVLPAPAHEPLRHPRVDHGCSSSPPELSPRCNPPRGWATERRGTAPMGGPSPRAPLAPLLCDCQDGDVANEDQQTSRGRSGGGRPAVIHEGLPTQLPDIDPEETQEWLE